MVELQDKDGCVLNRGIIWDRNADGLKVIWEGVRVFFIRYEDVMKDGTFFVTHSVGEYIGKRA